MLLILYLPCWHILSFLLFSYLFHYICHDRIIYLCITDDVSNCLRYLYIPSFLIIYILFYISLYFLRFLDWLHLLIIRIACTLFPVWFYCVLGISGYMKKSSVLYHWILSCQIPLNLNYLFKGEWKVIFIYIYIDRWIDIEIYIYRHIYLYKSI